MKKLLASVLLLCMLCSCAMAADLTNTTIANGVVSAVNYIDIIAPFSGTLEVFDLAAGDQVTAEDVLFRMNATTLYATEDATVQAVFAQPGDSADALMARYGSLMALEARQEQRIQCSITGAYNNEENRTIHVGETVYFESKKAGNEEGHGRVIMVSGDNYVVDILSGEFDLKENLTIYRDDDYSTKQNIGKGVVVRRDPVTVAGSGRVAEVLVQQGDAVKTGDALLTIVSADAEPGASPAVVAPTSGVVAAVAVAPGQQVWKGQQLARLYLTEALEIVAEVDEIDLGGLKVGDVIPCTLDMNEESVFNGTVTEISALGVTRQNAAYFTVHLSIDAKAPLGASASVYLPKK